MVKWLEKFRTVFRSTPTPDPLSERGENVAAKFLRNLGYKILERNYNTNVGEIDIIARDGKTLVFVQVKTRTYDAPTPEEQVNNHPQPQHTKAAKMHLGRLGQTQQPARLDDFELV